MAQSSNKPRNRRDLIKGGAAVAATAIVGFPFVSRAQNKPIKIGMPTIQSGRAAMVGSSSRNGCMLEIDKFNAAGGLGGRMIELVARDTKGKPEEAARLSRELVNSDGCEILFDAESSAGAFAIHEVAKDLGRRRHAHELRDLLADGRSEDAHSQRLPSLAAGHSRLDRGRLLRGQDRQGQGLEEVDDLLAGLCLRPRLHAALLRIPQALPARRRAGG